jgi:type IV pilus assembly protein PilQ
MRTKKTNVTAFVVAMMGYLAMLFGCAAQTGTKPVENQASAPRLAAIQAITTSEAEDGVTVHITADGPVTFSSLKQPDPLAVVIYLPETTVDQVQSTLTDSIGAVRGITVKNGSGNHTARIEIGLNADVPYTAVRQNNAVKLVFAKAAAPGTISAEAIGPEVQAGADPLPVARSAVRPASGQTGWVNKVDFLTEPDGRSTLVIGTSHAVDYTIVKSGPRRLDVRLANTRIPSYRQRPLITTRFNSAVDRVTPVAPVGGRGDSLIAVEMREEVPYVAEQSDNMLMVHFQPSAIPPKPLEQVQPAGLTPADMPGQSEGAVFAGAPAGGMMPVAPVSTPIDSVEQQDDPELSSLLGPRRKNFTGEKIALDFYETEIKNVFRIIREVSGKNFAIDKDVTGKVTMTLDTPVPWDQVLDLVLRMNQLGMVQDGDIIRVATLETLKNEDDLRKAKLEALRKSRDEAKALEPLMTKYIAVSYSNAAKEIKPHIEQILTKERGSVSVDEKNNQIIITDTAAKIHQSEEIVRRIDKVTSQVVIEAKVVEVSDEFSRELGIAWDMEYGPGELFGNAVGTDAAINFPAANATSSIGINFSRLSGVPFVLNARLNAMEATGKGKILSSPKILTLDNKKAKIKQGVEYAYLERDSSGGSSVKFKDIDLLLEVTPHVTPDNRISMSILITKNDVAGITEDGVPSVATNEAQTELLVNDGDTVVIGGIIKRAENNNESGFPLLKDIPILGYAFGNDKKKINSNELLIFIMPRIVQLEQAAVAQQ